MNIWDGAISCNFELQVQTQQLMKALRLDLLFPKKRTEFGTCIIAELRKRNTLLVFQIKKKPLLHSHSGNFTQNINRLRKIGSQNFGSPQFDFDTALALLNLMPKGPLDFWKKNRNILNKRLIMSEEIQRFQIRTIIDDLTS